MPDQTRQGDKATRVLLAARDDSVFVLIEELLSDARAAFCLGRAGTAIDASMALVRSDWDICIVDSSVGETDVSAVVAEIALGSIGTPIIVLGSSEMANRPERIEQAGAMDVLDRTVLSSMVLEGSLHYALKNQRYQNSLRASKDELIKQLLDVQEAMERLHTQGEDYAELVEHLADARDRAESSESRYRTLTEKSTVGIWQIALDGTTQYMNPAMRWLLELDGDEPVVGVSHESMLAEDGRQAFGEVRDKWLNGESESCEVALVGRRTKRIRHGVISGGVLSVGDGKVAALLATVIDITDRLQAEDQIRHLAGHDALTDLPNRVLFHDRLEQALLSSQRTNRQVVVLFLDLDHFKDVNDTLGHPAGDQLLIEASSRLLECVRRSDTVARFGGDEFAIIATSVDQAQGATMLATRIIESLGRPYFIDGQQVRAGTSVGITLAPVDGTEADKLLHNADLALYRAKDSERGTYQFYDSQMDTDIRVRKGLERDLAEALEKQQLSLHFQPQIDVKSGRPIGAEVLLRWRHPKRGNVPPSDFIPLAESTGAIVPIGEWVLQEACTEAKRWQELGLPPIPVAVNLSPVQFRKSTLVDTVSRILDDISLPPSRLELEVTEGMVMDDAPQMTERLQQLRSLGISLSIDDFGTGHSSLAYLKRFPISKLKIDQSFIRDITTDTSDAAIARTVILLGHNLDMRVVAEGVETADQLSILRSYGCDDIQGYYYCRPIAAGEFALWLSQYADDPVAAARAVQDTWSITADHKDDRPQKLSRTGS